MGLGGGQSRCSPPGAAARACEGQLVGRGSCRIHQLVGREGHHGHLQGNIYS